ncbi:arsenate reductase family protein [Nitratiruptor tergarcus]|uniref:Transcriptional regulator, Spx/MgsR family n=1 Tax=Nitratiruptor tergarcus DSM 16512 TaxID=1069081 RepID=A0A1W1WU73_9BACT|nr:arsenate reductase family protein [Nitratiruptor tergarcus]SMC09827.1 transcriptional regulator, Spx/MgsR family [Nitratiruptor tergarcus DSM 16512]
MIKVYGIKTCGSVKKALKFLEECGVAYEFIDFKKSPVGCDKIEEWLKHVPMDKLFNTRGTKYRQLGLKNLNLDEEGKKEWLCKENLLIKRPVIELENGDVVVGFDEEQYKEIFCGS